MSRAYELGEYDKVLEIGRELLAEATELGMDDLAEQLQEHLAAGRITDMQNVVVAMQAKAAAWDAERDSMGVQMILGMNPATSGMTFSMN